MAVHLPDPLNTDHSVKGRGWLSLSPSGRQVLTLTPGEHESAGIVLSAIQDVNRAIRHEITGQVVDGLLTLDTRRAADDQTRPDLRPEQNRAHGWNNTLGWQQWQSLMARLGGTPLDNDAVASWSCMTHPDTPPSERRLLGMVFVVKWMTPELREWVRANTPPDSVRIAPLIANREEDLLA